MLSNELNASRAVISDSSVSRRAEEALFVWRAGRGHLGLLPGPYEVQGEPGQGLDVSVGPWVESQGLQEQHHPLLLEHGAVVRGWGGGAK